MKLSNDELIKIMINHDLRLAEEEAHLKKLD